MSTAEDIEAAYGIDTHDLLALTSPPATTPPTQEPNEPSPPTAAKASLGDFLPLEPSSTPTNDNDAKSNTDTTTSDQPARPRIVRGRGNRLFGLMQSTLERASKELVKDQQKITARIQIQDRVRQQHQQHQAKLAALQTLKSTRQRLERDVTDFERRIHDLQMQLETPLTHLRLEALPAAAAAHKPFGGGRGGRLGGGRGGPYARLVILWRPGTHNERTRRELEAQREERQRGLEASQNSMKLRLERAKEELAVAARQEKEEEAALQAQPLSPTQSDKHGVVGHGGDGGAKDIEMSEGSAEGHRVSTDEGEQSTGKEEETHTDDGEKNEDHMEQD